MAKYIQVRGARTHNLKNISLDIPLGKISCLYGPSGSGKTSLAVHTLFAESKRRLLNSFPNSAKFFINIPTSVQVDSIEPVLPTWCFAQNNPVMGSRVNVLDSLGVREHLEKILFVEARPYCPVHQVELKKGGLQDCAKELISKYSGEKAYFFVHKDDQEESELRSLYALDFEKKKRVARKDESIFIELARFKVSDEKKINSKLKSLVGSREELNLILLVGENVESFRINLRLKCKDCDYSIDKGLKSWFDFSPHRAKGACKKCKGYGSVLEYDRKKLVKNPSVSVSEGAISFIKFKRFEHLYPALIKLFKKEKLCTHSPFQDLPEKKWDLLYEGGGEFPGFSSLLDYLEARRYKKNVRIFLRSIQDEFLCDKCEGTRVDDTIASYHVKIGRQKISYKEILKLNLEELRVFLEKLKITEKNPYFRNYETCMNILESAVEMNIAYLGSSRKTKTLSSGEYQKLILLKFLSFKGGGSLFILDEPSLGLSELEVKMVFSRIKDLKRQGNTVLVIDHNEKVQSLSDHVIKIGPGAGLEGGEIVYQGKYKKTKLVKWTEVKRDRSKELALTIKAAQVYDLKKRDIKIYKNSIHWVHGESGQGKSSYFVYLLSTLVEKTLGGEPLDDLPFSYKTFQLNKNINKMEVFSAEAGQVTSRSTVGTITDLAKNLRSYYSRLQISKSMNLTESHFSSFSDRGRCQKCQGKGVIELDMAFFEDIQISCEDCEGKKIKSIFADINDGEFSFYEAMNVPIYKLKSKIVTTPKFKRLYKYLEILKLTYLSLGRTIKSLSGGERQRIRLLSYLMKDHSNSILIFKNISYGLSAHELVDLYQFLRELSVNGVSIIVVDNNTLLETFADYNYEISDS